MNKVIVLGNINMDIVVRVVRHPVIGETVNGKSLQYFQGGKGANQAVAAATLGANTVLVGKIGDDDFSAKLLRFLKKDNLDISHVTKTREANTGIALITVNNKGENSIVTVTGANSYVVAEDIQQTSINSGDILVSQFGIPQEATFAFFTRGKVAGTTTIFNPAPSQKIWKELLKLVDILVVNEVELAYYIGKQAVNINNTKEVINAARGLQKYKDQIIVSTLGEKGIVAVSAKMQLVLPARKVKVVDTTGAGDCFIGALAARLSKNDPIENALKYAIVASSISVTKHGAGTSMPNAKEVEMFYE